MFRDGHVELDALDLEALDAFAWDWATRSTSSPVSTPVWPGAGSQATRWWQAISCDSNALLSLPRIPTRRWPNIRAFPGDGSRVLEAKHAVSFVGATSNGRATTTFLDKHACRGG